MGEDTIINSIRGAFLGLGLYLAGLDYELFIIWTLIAITDVVLGVLGAMRRGEFRSRKMTDGMIGKIMELFILLTVVFAQRAANILGYNIPAAAVLIGAFIFKDIGSILETAIENGVALPEKVKEWFDIAENQANKKED